MKTTVLLMSLTALLFVGVSASADCSKQAKSAAQALYTLNNQNQPASYGSAKLVSSVDSESGVIAVWDVDVDGTNAPYRIKTIGDECIVFEFSIPNAG